MYRYLLRRLAQAIPTLFAVIVIVFLLFNLVPGNVIGGGDADQVLDPQVAERIRAELMLDRPLHERFYHYMSNLVRGDLGNSFRTREPVLDMLGARLGPSLALVVAGMAIAILIGVPLGFAAALRQGSWIDTTVMTVAVAGQSVPQFWFGLLLMFVFGLQLAWLPTFGYGDGGIQYLLLPAFTLGIAYMALLARTTRAAVIEVMSSDFIRTARAKGLSEFQIVRRHLLRNTLVLILTTAGLQFGTMMGQAVIVEKLFAWPGLGTLLVDSVFLRDIPLIQGCILVFVSFFLIINTTTDLLYSAIDPRIRHS